MASTEFTQLPHVVLNITDGDDGFLRSKTHLIHDRDTKYTDQSLRILADSGIENVTLPRRSPNLKDYAPHCTSFVRSGLTSL